MDSKPKCTCGGGACEKSQTAQSVIQTDSKLRFRDHLGVIRVRLGIKRNHYQVTPGLYALGNPGTDTPVFISANYKLSFDILRKSLGDMDAWILVLDTRGINVWCAAGKGTFGSGELVSKIRETGLEKHVSHRELIVPQLGAPGVSAYEVEKQSGFKVVFGPVRAADIGEFLSRGKKADGDMRRVRFNFANRAKLVFVEGAGIIKYLLIAAALIFAVAFIKNGLTLYRTDLSAMLINITGVALVLCGGTVITPLLLPWLPGRSFSLKGLIAGAIIGLIFALISAKGPVECAAWTLVSAAASSFFAMMFTGASTYTSLSGTVKEMRRYVPLQIIGAAVGALLFIVPAVISAVNT